MPGKYAHTKKRSNGRKRPGSGSNNTISGDTGSSSGNSNSAGTSSTTTATTTTGSVGAAASAGAYNYGRHFVPKNNSTKAVGRAAAAKALAALAAAHRKPSPGLDRTLSATLTAVAELERAIAALLLLRYEADIARLYSARLHATVARLYLPRVLRDCVEAVGSPGWVALHARGEAVKDFFRAAIAMDLRQAGERVAPKSVLWSYTALRHFAMSNNVPICPKRGLHSLRLLPHFPALCAHLNMLQAMPIATFQKPTHLLPLDDGYELVEDYVARRRRTNAPAWEGWHEKSQMGYERLVETMWGVAREFDVRGYGLVLREKLTTKWCDCGCSTDHLGEVCERTVREEEEESGVRSGKGKEWDGRGSGVFGWQTEDEEDIWEMELDFGGLEPDECDGLDPEMTIGELMEWRYFKAERAKELGNKAFRTCDFESAIKHYTTAYETEPELPHYQLNLAAAHLKLNNWVAAEKSCNTALAQHKSGKGYWRRAKARRMQGRVVEAVKDLRAVLKLQPGNTEALAELMSVMPGAAADIAPRLIDSNVGVMAAAAGRTPSSSSSSSKTRSGQNGGGTGSRDRSDSSISSSSSSSSSATASATGTARAAAFSNSNSNSNNSNNSNNSALINVDDENADYPFALHPPDTRELRIYSPPLKVELPVLSGSGIKDHNDINGKDNHGNGNGSGKGKATRRTSGLLPSIDIQVETCAYPTWERCKVQVVVR